MAREIWVTLVHARPTSEHAADGIAGGYVWCASPAEDVVELEERVAAALAGDELEIVELDDAEAASARAERIGLSGELAELALRAAAAGEPATGTLHAYDNDDEDEDEDGARPEPAEPADALAEAHADQLLVTVRRHRDWERLSGFVVGVGERWLLLHVLDDAVRFDGWCAVREADVGRVDVMDPDDEFEPRALELRGDRPRRQPDVALGDVRALLASVQAISPLILLQTEADDPDIAYIGRIAAIDDGEIVLETVDRAGRWDDAERYRYADITRVEFGSGYLEALALVAGA